MAAAFMLAGIAGGDPAVARDIRRRVMNTLRYVVRSFVAFVLDRGTCDAPAGRLVVASSGPRE
jgi:hypothetical protein